MSVSTAGPSRDSAAAASATLLGDTRATSDLPASLHVLFDIGLADDYAQVHAALKALVEFQPVTGVRVRLGTAGGPASSAASIRTVSKWSRPPRHPCPRVPR
ncbi:MAG TPA: hypothetical protein VFU85_05380 [Nocardioides sp.]|nr:hypothetical protein [Nocardioides sp.]